MTGTELRQAAAGRRSGRRRPRRQYPGSRRRRSCRAQGEDGRHGGRRSACPRSSSCPRTTTASARAAAAAAEQPTRRRKDVAERPAVRAPGPWHDGVRPRTAAGAAGPRGAGLDQPGAEQPQRPEVLTVRPSPARGTAPAAHRPPRHPDVVGVEAVAARRCATRRAPAWPRPGRRRRTVHVDQQRLHGRRHGDQEQQDPLRRRLGEGVQRSLSVADIWPRRYCQLVQPFSRPGSTTTGDAHDP